MSSFGFGRIVSRGRLHRLLVARRERAQRVLHAVAELAEHLVGDVERILRDEEHADALAADQPHDLLDLLEQRRRRVAEQQVRLVEEEHELRLVAVADLGQVARTARRAATAGTSRRAAACCISLSAARMLTTPRPCASVCMQVVDVEHRLAEEAVAALLLELQQPALDRADRRRRDVAVLRS